MMTRSLLLMALVFAFTTSSFAETVIYMEEQGDLATDLSESHSNPTALGALPVGESLVIGFIDMADRNDRDIFRFVVGSNQQLDSITVAVEGQNHFLGIAAGTQISSTDASSMLIGRLISDSNEFDNLLTTPPAVNNYASQGVLPPLGAGDYTVWIQENSFVNFGYTFTFQTSEVTSIPEPSSLLALCFAGSGVALRRRRRS